MTITIRPEHEHLIVEAIQNGAYQSADDLIARALEVLRSEEEWVDDNKTLISEKIERGLAQFERGEFFTAEQSRAEMAKRKADWLRQHHA